MFKIILSLLFFLQNTTSFSCNKNNTNVYQTKIINTPIFYSLPKMKFHHIILTTKNKELDKMKDVYIFDYSQRAKLNPFTVLKLVIGCSVPSEIRVIHFPEVNETTLINDWYKKASLPNDLNKVLIKLHNENKPPTCPFMSLFKSSDYKNNDNIDKIIKKFNKPFNLYTNNCQSFSKYFVSNINKK